MKRGPSAQVGRSAASRSRRTRDNGVRESLLSVGWRKKMQLAKSHRVIRRQIPTDARKSARAVSGHSWVFGILLGAVIAFALFAHGTPAQSAAADEGLAGT